MSGQQGDHLVGCRTYLGGSEWWDRAVFGLARQYVCIAIQVLVDWFTCTVLPDQRVALGIGPESSERQGPLLPRSLGLSSGLR